MVVNRGIASLNLAEASLERHLANVSNQRAARKRRIPGLPVAISLRCFSADSARTVTMPTNCNTSDRHWR